MKKLFYLAFIILFTNSLAFSQENFSRIKVYVNNEELIELSNLGICVDHGERKYDTWFVSDFSTSEIQLLNENGFTYDVMIKDVQKYYRERNDFEVKSDDRSTCGGSGSSTFDPITPENFQLGTMAGFYTYEEFLEELDSMRSKFPDLITAKSPISTFTTHEGRPILWVKISDNPDIEEGENEVLYTAVHHAREPAGLSQLIFYMWYLLENYGTDDEVTYLVDNNEMYFVPMLNPDGYVHNQTNSPGGGGMHRKNKNPAVGTTNPGVDLNRNYGYHWNESGTSANQNNDTYAGSNAFSEPETQAIKWFCENRNFEFALNAHTYSNLLLFPLGWADAAFADEHDYFQAFSNHQVKFNGYAAIKASDLYPAAGDSDDWMYADDLATKPKIYAQTPEIGSSDDGFWPATSRILPLCKENVWMNLIQAHLPHIYGAVDDLDPTKITENVGYFHYQIERLGLEDGDITVSIEPISGIQTIGGANIHDLNLMDIEVDSISFILAPGISMGDEIKYVLKTFNGSWTRNDTITKTFGGGTSVFVDLCEDLDNWTGNWGITNEYFYSPDNCITDSPNNDYANNTTREIVLNEVFSFENATYAYIEFHARWEIEKGYDYTQFMISTDNGSTWIPLCGKYTVNGTSNQDLDKPLYDGFQTSWVLEEIDLTDYIGLTNIRFKFLLKSDAWVREDGFAFDDFSVFTDHVHGANIVEFEDNDIQIYPNPANSVINIYSVNKEQINQIEIYNELGQIIKTIDDIQFNNQINIEGFTDGIYFVKIYTQSQQIITKKVSVLR